MRTGLVALASLGALMLAAGAQATTPAPVAAPPPPPPPPPPANPRAPPASSPAAAPPVPKPAPRPSPPKNTPPVVTPVPATAFVPPPVHEVMVPAGWIAAMPSADLANVASDMMGLGDPAGTIYPFELNGKKYAGVVALDHTIAIIQPDDQL